MSDRRLRTMPEETKPTPEKPPAAKKVKEPAIEDKPFAEFMEQHFTPSLKTALATAGIPEIAVTFQKQSLPIVGADPSEQCWQIVGTWQKGQRQFNLYFWDETIGGNKGFSYSTAGSRPSTIESFMIDERKVSLDLMVRYVLQRLNGQKWLILN